MKWIIYNFKSTMKVLENKEMVDKEIICTAKEKYSEEKLEYVKTVAVNGKYTVEDDGEPDPSEYPTPEQRIAELEEALDLLLTGVTE